MHGFLKFTYIPIGSVFPSWNHAKEDIGYELEVHWTDSDDPALTSYWPPGGERVNWGTAVV